jgi:hypothetical protein
MKKYLHLLLIALGIALLGISTSFSQTMVYVATKHIDKDFSDLKAIEINAEKADIEIEVWGNSTVSLSMEISAKHPSKATAANDIEFLKYIAEAKNGVLFLRNYLLLSQKDKKPESNFKTKYVLKIPADKLLEIKNSFGIVRVLGKTEKLILKTEFCNVSLGQIGGVSQIKTKYGESNISGISGDFNLESERTNINLSDFSGNIAMKSYYGEVLLTKPRALSSLTYTSEKSTITLKMANFKSHKLILSTTSGQIYLPSELGKAITQKNGQMVEINSKENSNIKIHNKSGNITLEKL